MTVVANDESEARIASLPTLLVDGDMADGAVNEVGEERGEVDDTVRVRGSLRGACIRRLGRTNCLKTKSEWKYFRLTSSADAPCW